MNTAPPAKSQLGRPVATSHAEIERAAFGLFAEHGFEGTTLDMIAARVGIGRRTLFRYFQSKNDIPWGRFDDTLAGFRDIFRSVPADTPLYEAVSGAILAFNDFSDDADPPHRVRMHLILHTPSLQAHSTIKYQAWRDVIADYVAERAGGRATDPFPLMVGHVSLALAVSAYELWLASDGAELRSLMEQVLADLPRFAAAR